MASSLGRVMTKNPVIYREFGAPEDLGSSAVNLPPQQQNVRIQVTRRGKGGKTVTEVTGFQTTSENLAKLTKQLKTSAGQVVQPKNKRSRFKAIALRKYYNF